MRLCDRFDNRIGQFGALNLFLLLQMLLLVVNYFLLGSDEHFCGANQTSDVIEFTALDAKESGRELLQTI